MKTYMETIEDVYRVAEELIASEQGMVSSARVALEDARRITDPEVSAKHLMLSLSYSVGIFSTYFVDASRVTGIGWPIP